MFLFLNSIVLLPLIALTNILIVSLIILLAAVLIIFASFLVKKKKIENNAIKTVSENTALKQENKEIKKDFDELKDIVKFWKEEFSKNNIKLEETNNKIDSEVLSRTSELHTMLEKSEESNKLKDAFLEKISREVRTPLNAILGFINLLNNPDLPEHDRAYYYKYIQNSGNNLLGLIDNIIDFSKLETNELQIEPKKCRIHILLSDMVEKYRNRVIRENKNLTIIFSKTEEDIESLVDCKRVIHIADQLLSNAVKFTKEGRIELSYEIKNGNHHIRVNDTGIGIDKKYQDIIFERFYQIESETRDSFQGAGLGLTIAKGLVDLLGGEINLSSEYKKGSTFEFTIPFVKLSKHANKNDNSEKIYNWKNKNILIAEDEDSNYHFLEAVLKKTKVNLIRATDGVKFLEIMNENRSIDLVLLDIKMPGINGLNAIKLVRQQNITTPVIAQTAFNQPEDKQRCLDSGCNDYLAKPINKELLYSKIAKFFNN